ncbi:DUF7139 domain-containing protein [Natronomonas sp. EA1]|uniref:DUF7139 domain-containing protein n=1 Tax=Natronomonas sp. EA1 TaxID=3421655 RepID=UPI003EBF9A42
MTDTPDDRFVELYRRYLGEPERELDVYLGFGLFFGGFALGILGLVLFAVEQTLTPGDLFWVREIAYSVGALGLPTLLVGVTVLLPVDRRASYAAAVGLVVCLAAIAFFVSVYPSQWNVQGSDFSLQGVVIYAVGLVTVIASTGAALVSYHVERVSGGPAAAGEGSGADDGLDEEATAAQVERDIEEAMKGSDMSWGGVKKTETKRLQINPEFDDVDSSSFKKTQAKTHRGEGVDDALNALKGLKGGEKREARSSGTTDDQAAALRELRQKQREQQEQQKQGGFFARLKAMLGL